MTGLPNIAPKAEITHQRLPLRLGADRAEARAAARPFLMAWLKAVEARVRVKLLKDFDYRLAVLLTGFPSANEGYSYPGQRRLADKAGRSERTIRDALERLRKQRLLNIRRGGQGRTSRYTFMIDDADFAEWAKLTEEKPRQVARPDDRPAPAAALDRQQAAGLDRQQAADKPSELEPFEHSPPTKREAPKQAGLGEIVDFQAERKSRMEPMTGFDEFYEACRKVDGDLEGPARAEWAKLSSSDRAAINNLVASGSIDLGGFWACTWLKSRRWEQAQKRTAAPSFEKPPPACEMLVPYSAGWKAERARRIDAGLDVKFMDSQARAGKAWTAERHTR